MSTREFEFRDGSSDKFWKITLDGQTTTVNFGRRGTSGQTQTKEWASEGEAKKNCDKLIAEKTKKGYVETTSGATTATAAVAPKAPPAPKTPHPNPLPKTGEGTGSDPPLPSSGEGRGEGKPPEVAPAIAISTSLERRINLAPDAWALATWRKPAAPVERAAAAPFDRDACAAKLSRLRVTQYGWQMDWSPVELPDVMLGRAGIPVTLPPDKTELLVTMFHELRSGKTTGGKALEPLTTVMSTAEGVSVGYAAGIHAYYYGGGKVEAAHLVKNMIGSALKDSAEDLKKLRHYFNHVVKDRKSAGWAELYEARQVLDE